MNKIVIIGGGAAGFFTAINLAEKSQDVSITILEKTSKLLSKVKISGGGRCNVTNGREKPSDLVHFYPRGQKKLYSGFKRFGTTEMVQWLENHGISTHTEEDLRVFPQSNSSDTIVGCFIDLCRKYHIEIKTNCGVQGIRQEKDKWVIDTKTDQIEADFVVLATGSSTASWNMIDQSLKVKRADPVPSLFTFTIDDPRIQDLQGISFDEVAVKVKVRFRNYVALFGRSL
jgi:hypothetical protein